MADNLNNNQLDFYQNQIYHNPNNQANIVLKQDRREVSFKVDQNFLQSSFNKFLTENFNKIQNIEQNNKSIMQLYNIFQIIAQEIVKLKGDLTEAFNAQENKINNIEENKNQQINKICDIWNKENSKNINGIKSAHNAINENNQKISKELENQSKKLDESILNNNLNNDNIKKDFEILKSNLNLAQNKNNGNKILIEHLTNICNNNNQKISELEAKLLNLENNVKNKNEINKIKENLNEHTNKIDDNSNNILNFKNKFKNNNKEIDDKIKDKIDEMNELTVKKMDEITKEINKVKNEIINKKFDSIKIKDDKILNDLKEKINEFMESNNKIADEIKINHKKDIENIDK